jgi:Protein of unknown function (DUF3237)
VAGTADQGTYQGLARARRVPQGRDHDPCNRSGGGFDAGEYTFRTATQIETAAPHLDWLNKGVFISVAGRQAAGVIYETYLVALGPARRALTRRHP